MFIVSASEYAFSLAKKQSFKVRYLLLFRKLAIQILKVAFIMKMIAQIALTLIYRIFIDSVVPKRLILQLTAVTKINK